MIDHAFFCRHACNLNSSNLEPMVSEKHRPDEEEIVSGVQKRGGGKPAGRFLCLLLVIFAIIASELLYFHNNRCTFVLSVALVDRPSAESCSTLHIIVYIMCA